MVIGKYHQAYSFHAPSIEETALAGLFDIVETTTPPQIKENFLRKALRLSSTAMCNALPAFLSKETGANAAAQETSKAQRVARSIIIMVTLDLGWWKTKRCLVSPSYPIIFH